MNGLISGKINEAEDTVSFHDEASATDFSQASVLADQLSQRVASLTKWKHLNDQLEAISDPSERAMKALSVGAE